MCVISTESFTELFVDIGKSLHCITLHCESLFVPFHWLSTPFVIRQVWARLQPLWIAWSCIKGFILKHHFGGSRGQRSKYPQPHYPSMKMFLPSHSASLLAMAFYGSSQGGARWERDDGGCNIIMIFLSWVQSLQRFLRQWLFWKVR
jgi:hypothetical protein